jgi:glycosyltransferase involved in cell wall biosynthesis
MKKRIIVFSKFLKLGGSEKRIIRIINNLNVEKYDIYIATKSLDSIHNKILKEIKSHIKIICVEKYNSLNLYLHLRKYSKFDVSICLNNFIGLLVSLLLRVNKKIIFEGGNRSFDWRFYKKILDKIFIFPFADKIFVNSNYSANLVYKSGCDKKKIAIVKNGFEKIETTEFSKPKEYDSLYLNCVTVSRLHKIKNVENFVEVFDQLRDYKIKLFIIGGGEEYNNILNKVKDYKLENNIFLLGEKSDFYNYLIYSDIFLFASLSESLPNSITEAMSFSLPVIAYDVGGIKELVIDGYNGFVVKKNDVNYFADKIKFFYVNRDTMKKYGENSKTLFLENFTIDKMILNFEERIIE